MEVFVLRGYELVTGDCMEVLGVYASRAAAMQASKQSGAWKRLKGDQQYSSTLVTNGWMYRIDVYNVGG